MNSRAKEFASKELNVKILVTGSAGFIGSRVSELLIQNGYQVLGIDSLNNAYDERLKQWRLSKLRAYADYEFLQADIVDYESIEDCFSQNNIDAVINLAAQAGVRNSSTNPLPYYETNVIGTLNLLELSKKNSIPKFVQASTSSVYGNGSLPFKENSNTDNPESPYAASKKSAELICHTYHTLNDMNVTVLRYFTVYGPSGRPDMAVFRFIHWIYEGKPVILFGDGSQQRDFTYIDDIASGTIAALNCRNFNLINLGNDRPIDLNSLINIIEETLNKKAILQLGNDNPADVKGTWAHISEAKRILKWEPYVSIEEGIKRSVDWYLQNRDFVASLHM